MTTQKKSLRRQSDQDLLQVAHRWVPSYNFTDGVLTNGPEVDAARVRQILAAEELRRRGILWYRTK